jgi:hypothetical protein
MKKSKKESSKQCIGELMHALTNQPPLSESTEGKETG